ncbi:unnamed protein product [Ambrosiozyma monospora]|uniref:Unnamed protein product n=1 Tax=Ambrosiozyma monospora TaxID=43982 RepID=A0ACB5SS92_AMBMO|nr:unnamed protein product [Ambrosiozyma monospora]
MTTFESTASLNNFFLTNSSSQTTTNSNNNNFPPNADTETQITTTPIITGPLTPFAPELTEKIIEYTYFNDPEHIYSINSNVKSFGNSISLVNSNFYFMSLKFFYKYANFTRSFSFDLFLKSLIAKPMLGKYTQYLDFSEFTSVGLGRTGQMMKEIQMVTGDTILQCLRLTPNLKEFLASESIESDLNFAIIDYLFNKLPHLKSLDFCGCSGQDFSDAFDSVEIHQDDNCKIENLSFHDCTDLKPDVFRRLLPKLHHLKRLDLNHTQVTAKILIDCLPQPQPTQPHSHSDSHSQHQDNTTELEGGIELTHLSIGRCSNIGSTRDLLRFFTKHPAVNNHSLQWLNIQCDTTVASPFNSVTLAYLLNHLKAKHLRYLNLGGLEVEPQHLKIIQLRFPELESLVLANSELGIDELSQFLGGMSGWGNLKFLDLSGNKKLTRWSIDNNHFLKICPSLVAIEVDERLYDTLTYTTGKIQVFNNFNTILPSSSSPVSIPLLPCTSSTQSQSQFDSGIDIWKPFNNNGQGRRNWIFKLNQQEKQQELKGEKLIFNDNIVYFDLHTGERIMKKIKFPGFLKLASRKINCSCGPFGGVDDRGGVFPGELTERGLYRYYSLNK